MKRKEICLLLALVLGTALNLYSQDVLRYPVRRTVTLAGKDVNRIFIPPPEKFLKTKGSKGTSGAKINLYSTGFTGQQKVALEYAVGILASVLPSNAEITISATWRQLADDGVLGQSGATSFIRGAAFDAPHRNVYYPVPLAEKMAGKPYNPSLEADINLTINSKATWYLGTDGNHPVGSKMYDLVTVILHELIHGLGFFDSFSVDQGSGSYGLGSLPVIYDMFVENADGKKLIANPEFPNNSAELYSQLTGDKLYFNGPLLTTFTNGIRARLYAPAEFMPGSSIAHLDETRTSQVNKLMTPYVSLSEVIHSPGNVTMSILGDLGWVNTRIEHEKFSDTEEIINSLLFEASIDSDTTLQTGSAALVYSYDNFQSDDTLFLVPPSSGKVYSGVVSTVPYNKYVSYYFSVTDRFGRNYMKPSSGSAVPYKFYIGADTAKPSVSHKVPEFFFDKVTYYKILCTANDNLGIDTVYVEYKKNNGPLKTAGLSNDSLDIYSGKINLKSEFLVPGDILYYRIVAKDRAINPNTKYFPSSGYQQVNVLQALDVRSSFETDFIGAAPLFIMNGFNVIKPATFPGAALHSKHPYESPDKDGEEIVYTAYLKHPVLVDETGIVLTYKEIVLVEPGEPGSVYGDPDFFDYVVVEGSRDFGASWFSLEDGYDSRISSTFESAYNSLMSGNNSIFSGTQNMFEPNTIDIRTFTNFSKGDTLMLRFRLYSDPFAHGWGWAVDDLSIKSVAAGVDDVSDNLPAYRIFPNPGNGIINIETPNLEQQGKTDYAIYTLTGVTVKKGYISATGSSSIDFSGFSPGAYIIVFKSAAGDVKFKYIKTAE